MRPDDSLSTSRTFSPSHHPQYYKVARGKPTNTIVGGTYQNATVAARIVHESHGYWQDLMRGKAKAKKISREQTANPKWCKTYVDSGDAADKFDMPRESKILPAAERPKEFDHWYYLDADFKLIELPGQ